MVQQGRHATGEGGGASAFHSGALLCPGNKVKVTNWDHERTSMCTGGYALQNGSHVNHSPVARVCR